MNGEHTFLRSINLVYDAAIPERIAHYQPTSKAVAVLEGIGGERGQRAYFVIAPYGSGKSICATYLLHLIENRPASRQVLAAVVEKLKPMAPWFARFAERRLSDKRTAGVVIALTGAVDDLGAAVTEATAASLRRIGHARRAKTLETRSGSGITGAIAAIDELQHLAKDRRAKGRRIDRLTLLWDEFGRHVEQIVRSGDSHRLSEIQTLAEYTARTRSVPVTLGLIMHQGLPQYASGLSQTTLAEWRKIEGRFEAISYIDDSPELYRLIAEIVTANRPDGYQALDARAASKAAEHGILADIGAKLPDLLARAAPLEPATLHVLPRLAARAAQHERTLFGFLLGADLSRAVTPDQLYDYFSSAMQTDTALGGTYRKWLETESALSKAESAAEVQALKTATIMELGLSGERRHLTRAALEFALGDNAQAERTVDRLIERKLLLHRQRTGQLSLWHGTDVDLRGRLKQALALHARELDVVGELNREFVPPPWRPARYNDNFCMRRYFAGSYSSIPAFARMHDRSERLVGAGEDGAIIYLVPKDEAERERARILAEQCADPRVLVVVPNGSPDIGATVAEVACLEQMRRDESLLSEDPLVDKELGQMLDEARGHLHAHIARLTHPGRQSNWYHAGKALPIDKGAELLEVLSDICDQNFPGTPRINNEMIVRHRLSGPLVNARKKVLLGILERHGEEKVGIDGENADASVFRTVLANTGLYRRSELGDGWRYAEPEELDDPNLQAVWQQFKALVTEPNKQPEPLAPFFEALIEPPYGLRRGVLPILFAAALRAFQSALAITDERGEYLEDLLPSDIEAICRGPGRYRISVVDLNDRAREYLMNLVAMFSPQGGKPAETTGDLMRTAYDVFEAWRRSLPPGAFDTRVIGQAGRRLQQVLRTTFSPIYLFLQRFPQLAESNDMADVEQWLTSAKREVESVVASYRSEALGHLDGALRLGTTVPGGNARARFAAWRDLLGADIKRLGGTAKSLLGLKVELYADDEAFINAVAAIIVGKQPKRWNDGDLHHFRNETDTLIGRIENAALAGLDGACGNGQAARSTALLERRLRQLAGHLVAVLGKQEAERRLSDMIRELGDK